MAHLIPESPNPLRELFSIVQMPNQNYAEIETEFVRRHRERLNSYWNVVKNDTDCHKIRFNNDYDNPLILIQGWIKFKEFHNLPDNVEIQMIFHGNNLFEVSAIRELKSRIHIPPFHSMSLNPHRTETFAMELRNIDFYDNNLSVEDNLGDFLCAFNITRFVLCGDKGQHFFVHTLNMFTNYRIKIGFNWDEICDSFKFKPGQKIQFKFERNGNNVSNRCHLSKLD